MLASSGHTAWQRTVSPGDTDRAVQQVLDARSGYTRLTLVFPATELEKLTTGMNGLRPKVLFVAEYSRLR